MIRYRIQTLSWAGAIILACGCGSGSSADQRITAELARTGQSREEVCPLAGKVTVDGEVHAATKRGRRLVVTLYEVSDPPVPWTTAAFTECKADGSFSFETLKEGDGIAPGNYVATFAELAYSKNRGYHGTDGLKNLYNDPAKNAKLPEFNMDHRAPGRTDYAFDLKVAGEAPVEQPADPHGESSTR
jgi:hypothetical protein